MTDSAADWVDLPSAKPLTDFLADLGLNVDADALILATGASTIDDLARLDDFELDAAASSLDPKPDVPKLRAALAHVRGDVVSERDAPEIPAEQAEGAPTQQKVLDEVMAIAIDRSGSMRSPLSTDRTRMEAAKQMFYAFRDRVESLDGVGGRALGLLQFDHECERLLTPTTQLDAFEASIDDMKQRGQTAIYSAIVASVRMLEPFFNPTSPRSDLRVVLLTDGQNNSGIAWAEAAREARRMGVVVDAIIVGDSPDAGLRKIVTATGGQCFQINSLSAGFELLEAEAVVSLHARRGGREKPPLPDALAATTELLNDDDFAPAEVRKSAPVPRAATSPADGEACKAVSVREYLGSMGKGGGSTLPRQTPTIRRLLKELKDVASGRDVVCSGEGIHIFPTEGNLFFWRVLIEGPAGTPFEGGTFAAHVEMHDCYPLKPPKFVFDTPIFHPNVSDAGDVCLDILKQNWSPAITVPKVIESVRSLMRDPNPNDWMRHSIAELMLAHLKHGSSDTRYFDQARQDTLKHAGRTVADWRAEWGCAE